MAGTVLAFEMLEAGCDFRIVSAPDKSKASMVAAGMVNPLVFKRITKSWMVDKLLPVMKTTYSKREETLGELFYFEKELLRSLLEQEKQLWQIRKKQTEFANYIGAISEKPPINFLTESDAYAIVNGAGYLNIAQFLNASERFFRERDLLIEKEFVCNSCSVQLSGVEFGCICF